MKALAFLISLSLLVVTHELGHLFFAKLFHTRVRRFYVFFNWKFSLCKAKKFDGKWHFLFFNAQTPESWDEKNLKPEDQDNTLWGIGWIPLGGYCDIAGMIDETKSAPLAAVVHPLGRRVDQLRLGTAYLHGHILALGHRRAAPAECQDGV